ncbi:hypothetical protein K502DRAFT_344934 [Neoconidiobolus thromboides FSU 785]|nr:hypothetical protein K502DRAFT_344934 [Neoconidiobolus thromboides FSU 785]
MDSKKQKEEINKKLELIKECIKLLTYQREQAEKDIAFISNKREYILSNPIDYLINLDNNKEELMPKRQKIIAVPNINQDNQLSWLFNPNETTTEETRSINTTINTNNTITTAIPTEEIPMEPVSLTYNLPWNEEENRKLLELLQVYPPEEVAFYRYEKISKVMVTRSAKQIQSRIQKLTNTTGNAKELDPYIKKVQALLKIKKRRGWGSKSDNKNKTKSVNSIKNEKEEKRKDTGFRLLNTPLVYMSDDDTEEAKNKIKNNKLNFLSKLNELPTTTPSTIHSNSPQNSIHSNSNDIAIHLGIKCNNCNIQPIVGTRWKCIECKQMEINLCDKCIIKGEININSHLKEHRLEKYLLYENNQFLDSDYNHNIPDNLDKNYLSTW